MKPPKNEHYQALTTVNRDYAMPAVAIIGFVAVVLVLFSISVLWQKAAARKRDQRMMSFNTYTGLIGVAKACDEYKKQCGVWPTNINQTFPLKPDMMNWAKDSWGRCAVLIPYDKSLGYGEIISYGRDKKPGGTGADQDIVLRFPVEANAAWDEQIGEILPRPGRMHPWSNWFYGLYDIKPPQK